MTAGDCRTIGYDPVEVERKEGRGGMADKGGLEGIVVARSRLCSIDGQKGVLIYGGYDVNEPSEPSSYQETCFLILRGRLPSAGELEEFRRELASSRALPEETA